MHGSFSEQYGYDGDTNRVYRTRNGITTFYLGQWEEDSTGVKKQYYSFGGNTVAMRDSSTNAVTYLHSDHLGSVSLATTSNGTIASQQYFDPWGKVKSGGIGQTSLNYTGQRLDGTGLLYYNARYYDPALGKFLCPDTIIPAPDDNQSRNRYTYSRNNPLRFIDPTGHTPEEDQAKIDKTIGDVAAQAAALTVQAAVSEASGDTEGAKLARAEVQSVNENLSYLTGNAKTEDKLGFVDFMTNIQAGTIMNYEGFPLLPSDNHTAIGVDPGVMVEAPQYGKPVRFASAASIWTNGSYDKNHIKLYEVPGITSEQRQKAANFAKSQIGKDYAWVGAGALFPDSWYCTALVIAALESAGVEPYKCTFGDCYGGQGPFHWNPWDIPSAKVRTKDGNLESLTVTWDGSKK